VLVLALLSMWPTSPRRSTSSMHSAGNQILSWLTCATCHAKPNTLPMQSSNVTPSTSTLCCMLQQLKCLFVFSQ
jgi:hypothetical protein